MGVFKWDMLLCLCVDGGCIGCYNETYQLLHSAGGVGVENHTELSITASWEEWGGTEAWSPTGERPRFLTGSLRTSQGGGGARTLSAPAFAG